MGSDPQLGIYEMRVISQYLMSGQGRGLTNKPFAGSTSDINIAALCYAYLIPPLFTPSILLIPAGLFAGTGLGKIYIAIIIMAIILPVVALGVASIKRHTRPQPRPLIIGIILWVLSRYTRLTQRAQN